MPLSPVKKVQALLKESLKTKSKSEWQIREERTRLLAERFIAETRAVSEDTPIDLEILMGEFLNIGDLPHSKEISTPDVQQVYTVWAIDYNVSQKIKNLLPIALNVYERLVAKGSDYESKIVYNDLDNKAFYIPSPPPEKDEDGDEEEPLKIWSICTQNTNYLYILQETVVGYDFHIRQYWDRYVPDEDDSYQKKEDERYRNGGIEYAILKASFLAEYYADDILDNKYPKRPSLDFFKDANFKMNYQDSRDKGYILSYKENLFKTRGTDYSMPYYGSIDSAMQQLYYVDFGED